MSQFDPTAPPFVRSPANLGPFSSYSALPAGMPDGTTATIPRLVGGGGIRMIVEGGRWAVEVGQVIASALDPFSVAGAGAATNYDQTFCTIPVGMWGEGEEWEFAQPTESASTNIGTVASRIFIGSYETTWQIAAARRDAAVIRFVRRNSNPRRTWLTIGTSVDNSLGYITPDMSQPLMYRHRLTFASAGDSGYIIHSHIKRHA